MGVGIYLALTYLPGKRRVFRCVFSRCRVLGGGARGAGGLLQKLTTLEINRGSEAPL